ncbi:hypothetical protein TEA_007719 [Camellia sinensis var. sinensis]|uniref:Uncharacterized protein n=1 Tax=Camellia sinensis var. sinensis TaxID=542762 RepID=A0A4S4D0D0_CAMSN|nr:hypothetical protein TEA_007719 [Camellia sinensis var. sinensis]
MCALSAGAVLDMDDASNKAIPRWPWFVFLAGAMGCLICSSLSHLFACHSKRWNVLFWRLDYAGIALMIVCSFFAPIYYAFSCNPYSRFLYLTSISLLGILVIITLLAPALSTPRFRSFKACLFLRMGFLGVIPATHDVVFFWGHPQMLLALGYELVMGVLHAVGASFYMRALAHSAATLPVMDWHRGLPNYLGNGFISRRASDGPWIWDSQSAPTLGYEKGMSPLAHPNFLKEGSYGCFKDGLGPRLGSKLVMEKLPHPYVHAARPPGPNRMGSRVGDL